MPSRRDLHRLTLAAAAGAAVPAAWSTPAAAAAPTVTETSTQVTVNNGPVQLVVTKSGGGRATSLRLGGRELLGGGGVGYYDVVSEAVGTPVALPPAGTTYRVRRGADFVDVSCEIGPSSGAPFTTVRHFIVRTGEPGIHLATEFRHSADAHAFKAVQHRFVLRVNPAMFTHASVQDDPIGLRWRAAAAVLPTPAHLRAAPAVMDATDDLNGLGSSYPRRYYTKYDWATYHKDHVLHGFYGNGYGVWAVLANKEAFCGGPTRQDLTLHQTETTPVLLVEPQATHYGSPALAVRGAWSKTYGPYFIHLNTGTDPVALRADAMRYTRPGFHQAFYDQLGLPGWVPTTQRATVSGRVTIPGTPGMTGAVAVLSDNRLDFQRTVLGFQYWADVNADGSFQLAGVRPGRYRLTVYRPGVWGEFVRDDVVVEPGRALRIPDASWSPVSHGRTLWQIGTPDRTSAEFRRGRDFRQWGLESRHLTDFPNGVTYTVGTSTNADWNYVQYQRLNGTPLAPWRIRFNLAAAPASGAAATLTIALAAWSLETARPVPDRTSSLNIGVNGSPPLVWTFQPDDSRSSLYRSGTS
ncbi:MAG TPA: polysaccharide lyase family protein, partial [Catenuloplanes sp.]